MKESIKRFIIDTLMFGEGELSDDEPLFESGIIDSMGFVKLLSFIENELGVPVDMSEVTMEKFGTVNDIVNFVQNKIKP